MNWGKWIVVSFALFAGFIAVIVTISMKQDVSLVSNQYYQDDLEFQHQLDRKNNTALLAHQPEFVLTDQQLQVTFPEDTRIESGVVKLFRPSSDKLDQNFVLQATNQNIHVFSLNPLNKGAYRIKMTWTMDSKEYYLEKFIVL